VPSSNSLGPYIYEYELVFGPLLGLGSNGSGLKGFLEFGRIYGT
jgi:hypothetical protein